MIISIVKKLQNRFTLGLLAILALAIILRFLYFPTNIYFGFDQARDAFISQELLKGHLKIVGPTTSTPGLNHGALFYYIFAPIYFFGNGNPEALSIFLRLYNALGIVLIFFIGTIIFNRYTGLLSALLFAFSYEQTQYALYMTHPALAVLTVLLYYLGLSLFFFKKKTYGLTLAAIGLGLSFQFHFLLFYLGFSAIIMFILLRNQLPKLNLKVFVFAGLALFFTTLIYIAAEIKFGFPIFTKLFQASTGIASGQSGQFGLIDGAIFASKRYIQDNLFFDSPTSPILLLVFATIAVILLKTQHLRPKIIFLLIWFIVGLFSYFISKTSLYFYGVGTSLSLIIFASFLLNRLYKKLPILSVLVIIVILISNLYLITKNNSRGPNPEINVQTGMMLSEQKKVIDYIYSKAGNDRFAVNALTMPLNINTTWSYLFEWYGAQKYGRLPVWGGIAASGYPGNLEVNNSRSTLPDKRFLIIEPTRGVENHVKSFLTEEGWFTDTIEERRFGEFIVRFQKPK